MQRTGNYFRSCCHVAKKWAETEKSQLSIVKRESCKKNNSRRGWGVNENSQVSGEGKDSVGLSAVARTLPRTLTKIL